MTGSLMTRHRLRRATADAGMSLVEVLVSLTISTIVVIATSSAVITALRAERHAADVLERARQIVAVADALAHDAAHGDRVVVRDDGFEIWRGHSAIAVYRHDPQLQAVTVVRSGRSDVVLRDLAMTDDGRPALHVQTSTRRLTIVVRFDDDSRWAATAPLPVDS